MRWCLPLPLICTAITGSGQQAVVPAGQEASGPGGTSSWTVGQIDYEATQSTGGSVQRGVQQPYEWLVMSVEQASKPSVSAWPNPTNDHVRLEWTEPLADGARYQLCSNAGALISEGSIRGTRLDIHLGQLASGGYVVRIFERGRIINTMTIQKQ